MERVIENNKLIAEFMGLTTPNKYDGGKTFAINPRTIDGEIWAESWFNPDYHTNWNSLMPVVEKIKKNKASVILLPKNGIDKSIAPYIEKCRPLSKALLKVDMEMIYNSVVDFIKWHNEYSLSTDKTKTV